MQRRRVLAVARRELAATFGQPTAYVFVASFLAVTGFLGLYGFFTRDVADLRDYFHGLRYAGMFLAPAAAMRAFAEERRQGTYELLFTLPLLPGEVVLGRGGLHLVVERGRTGLVTRLSPFPQRLHVPSVDVLFESAAAACGRGVVGVVLTGMGDDGARGAAALRRAGAPVLTEAESTAVIWGMPRAVQEAGHSTREVALGEMARAVLAEV